MIDIDIPNFGNLSLAYLVIDYNGTLAVDGKLLPGAREVLSSIANDLKIHVITADSFGLAEGQLTGLPVELTILSPENQSSAKLRFINHLGASNVVAIGNGRNDAEMLKAAALGIAVIQKEGAAMETLCHADLVTTSVWDALDLLTHPKRLLATLRS